MLATRGSTYQNALTTAPSDSFPGTIAQMSGGTSKSTGVFYDDSYERTHFLPNNIIGSNCAGLPGAETQYAENVDVDSSPVDSSPVDAGGTLGQPLTQIDPNKLSRKLINGVCTNMLPQSAQGQPDAGLRRGDRYRRDLHHGHQARRAWRLLAQRP